MPPGKSWVTVLVSLVLAATAVACDAREEEPFEEEPLAEEPLGEGPVADDGLVEEPGPVFVTGSSLLGETVTLAGDVDEVVGPHSFRIGGDIFTEPLLVLGAQANKVSEGDSVILRGRLLEFEVTDAEDELGVDLDDDALVEFEEQFALVAHRIKSINI